MAASSDGNILLIVPPFQETMRPALGVSQLKANLQEQGFPTSVLYLNLLFADRIGLGAYEWIVSNTFDILLGEFIFSDVLFQQSDDSIEKYATQVLANSDAPDQLKKWFPHKNPVEILRHLMDEAATFCHEDAMREILSYKPWMTGFTTSFQQNCSSLALIKGIKQREPNILTVMGGANCQGEMGEELFQRFPEIDYIGQGECDHSFVSLVHKLRNKEKQPHLSGFLSRATIQNPQVALQLQGNDLDKLPHPDFSDYFAQVGKLNDAPRIKPILMMETSRGCWWGAKQQCTFCGLNGTDLGYRCKSVARAIEEMTALADQYSVRSFLMVDNILDMQYFKTFLPELAKKPIAEIFYETKVNLSRSQVHLMAQADIRVIQPGIESLSDQALRLMNKGATKLHNIQLLKWCAEFNINVGWNYLYGFPGEDEKEITRIADEAELLHHLQPPANTGTIRIDRFSPYFNNPAAYGLNPISPADPYHHIYPFSSDSLKRIAYFFQSDFFIGTAKSDAFKKCKTMIINWQKSYPRSYLLAIPRKTSLIILDTRPCAKQLWHRLVGPQRKIYDFCDKAYGIKQIHNIVGSITESELEAILNSLLQSKLMIHANGRYLSLAVGPHKNCGKITHGLAAGFITPRKNSQHFLRLIRFQIPLREIPSEILQRITNKFRLVRMRVFSKAIRHITHFLSEPQVEESTNKKG